MMLPDALPLRYTTDQLPGVGGRLKVRIDDFIVEEVPLYEPSGSGEHLYLMIEKRGRPTLDVVRQVAKRFGVSPRAMGYAGMKDKHAVTTQVISVHTPNELPASGLGLDNVKLLWADRHTAKLRVGHLRGNRFRIKIREFDRDDALARAQRIMTHLSEHGVANFFGEQRFGFHGHNHLVGRACLREDWDACCNLLLAPYRKGDDENTPVDPNTRGLGRAERVVAKALSTGRTSKNAVLAIRNDERAFYVTAFQSAIFNQILAQRIDDGLLESLIVGDLAWKHDSRAVFAVTESELEDPALAERLAALQISPSGPLWGSKMTQASDRALAMEMAPLEASDVDPHAFKRRDVRLRGARRPLRVPLLDVALSEGTDDHGSYLEVCFQIPRGVFATTVLREVMKTTAGDHPWAPAQREPRSFS